MCEYCNDKVYRDIMILLQVLTFVIVIFRGVTSCGQVGVSGCGAQDAGSSTAEWGFLDLRYSPTYQSSIYGHMTPNRGVDGNEDSNFGHGSCTCTKNTKNSWWMVDLETTHEISAITLVNRGDCCPERLSKFKIIVSNYPIDLNFGHDSCNVRATEAGAVGKRKTYKLSPPVTGRYVAILKDNGFLTLCEVKIQGRKIEKVTYGIINLTNKPSFQSSTYNDMTPHRAIDGKEDPKFAHGSCMCTQNTRSPWWMVDLGCRYEISSITLVNRGDCCPERLSKFKIIVTDYPIDPDVGYDSCFAVNEPGKVENRKTYNMLRYRGRYVTILKDSGFLTMCEVIIKGRKIGSGCKDAGEDKPKTLPPKNINLKGKHVEQSSVHDDPRYSVGTPNKAIDGNLNTDFNKAHSCTHTKQKTPDGSEHWWRVDLGGLYDVTKVALLNRGDCCNWRLKDFTIFVTKTKPSKYDDVDDDQICNSQMEAMGLGEKKEFKCDKPIRGRYVSITRPSGDFLTLCEVWVTGGRVILAPPAPPPSSSTTLINLKGKPTKQSSTRSGAVSSQAVDGNRNFRDKSCTHTLLKGSPTKPNWWYVDLQHRYRISYVALVNRGDCCSDRLRNFKIVVTNAPLTDFVSIPDRHVCAKQDAPLGVAAIVPFSCPTGMNGRYVTVVHYHNDHLTLCEVEIAGVRL
ncbi:uncharacterized protein LOC141906964 [Tubulanus polymorphus]|uniref:uncharacterized protein LOC141906964 n=1 Tax=Tubulanus polymorphus TaxID=672921 RepID=UPI003DA260EE